MSYDAHIFHGKLRSFVRIACIRTQLRTTLNPDFVYNIFQLHLRHLSSGRRIQCHQLAIYIRKFTPSDRGKQMSLYGRHTSERLHLIELQLFGKSSLQLSWDQEIAPPQPLESHDLCFAYLLRLSCGFLHTYSSSPYINLRSTWPITTLNIHVSLFPTWCFVNPCHSSRARISTYTAGCFSLNYGAWWKLQIQFDAESCLLHNCF